MNRPLTPRGFRDVLPEEAAERDAVSQAMIGAAAAWGYRAVETPVAEEASVLGAGAGQELERSAFRLTDLDGSLLALRPEMTVPIARLVASRLAGDPGPHRLAYVAPVFREHESLRGQPRQFTQMGVELVGAGGAVADAEVVCVLSDALARTGLAEYTVGVGSVAVLLGVLDVSGGPAAWKARVLEAAHRRDLVGLGRLAGEDGVPAAVADALRVVPRLRGGREAIEECRRAVEACGRPGALDGLEETWDLLEAGRAAERVVVDFGIMRSFDYYTGLVVEAYAPGLGLPLGGGGRYDELLSAFGAPIPAAGFALGLERVMIALSEQGRVPRVRGLDAVVGGETPAGSFAAARRLREAGWRVEIVPDADGPALAGAARRRGAPRAVFATRDGTPAFVDGAGGIAPALPERLPAPPEPGGGGGT